MAIRTDSFFDDEDEEDEGEGEERGEGEEEEEEADEDKGEEEAMGFLSFRKVLEAEEAMDVVEGEVRTWWQTMIWGSMYVERLMTLG